MTLVTHENTRRPRLSLARLMVLVALAAVAIHVWLFFPFWWVPGVWRLHMLEIRYVEDHAAIVAAGRELMGKVPPGRKRLSWLTDHPSLPAPIRRVAREPHFVSAFSEVVFIGLGGGGHLQRGYGLVIFAPGSTEERDFAGRPGPRERLADGLWLWRDAAVR